MTAWGMRTMPLLLLLAAAAPAGAEVKSASPNGFVIEHQVTTPVPPTQLYRAIGQVRGWWNPAHSYSGKAENLTLELRPGGCFCETLPGGGGIEHLRTAYVDPGKRVVLTGALGPMLYLGVSGVMDLQIEAVDQGSRVKMTYRAAGFAEGGADKLAPAVDKVLGEQMQRLAAAAPRL